MSSTEAFQRATCITALYPEAGQGTERALNYAIVGLGDETGEVLGKWKKHLRGDGVFSIEDLQDEVGDVLWYAARIAEETNTTLEEIMRRNVAKLMDRKDRGVIMGNGDKR